MAEVRKGKLCAMQSCMGCQHAAYIFDHPAVTVRIIEYEGAAKGSKVCLAVLNGTPCPGVLSRQRQAQQIQKPLKACIPDATGAAGSCQSACKPCQTRRRFAGFRERRVYEQYRHAASPLLPCA